MHQLIMGASIPLIAALLLYAVRRGHASTQFLIITPFAMGASAIWAIAPDLPRLFGFQGLYSHLAQQRWTNIFFWHYSIDKIEAAHLDAMTPLFNAIFALLLAGLLAIAWLELFRSERRAG
jgi:hypothetical protein